MASGWRSPAEQAPWRALTALIVAAVRVGKVRSTFLHAGLAFLTLHTRVLTSVSWPRGMRVLDSGATGCVFGQLRNVKFCDSSDVRSNWLVKDKGRHTTLAIQVSLSRLLG